MLVLRYAKNCLELVLLIKILYSQLPNTKQIKKYIPFILLLVEESKENTDIC